MIDCPVIVRSTIVVAAPSREKVERLEALILECQQVDLKTTHKLSGGVYARTITIPAGTVLTGAAHKKDHINIVQGDITVSTDEGMKRLTGQHVLTTKAGNKRVGLAHANTIWTTVCQTFLTDFDEIEAELVEEPERLQTRQQALTTCEALES
jgi:hypothetical protein